MLYLLFHTQSHYPVKRKLLEDAISKALKGKIKRDVEVSVSIIGNRKMHALNKQYRKIDAPTDVLSFSLTESFDPNITFVEAPDNRLRLGDIVISYPEAVKLAQEKNTMVDDAIVFLALHGLNHLLGIHHPE